MKLFIAMLFALTLVGCASPRPTIDPVVLQVLVNSDKDLTESVTVKKETPSGTETNTETHTMNPQMALFKLEQRAQAQQQVESLVATDPSCTGSYAPSYCYSGGINSSGAASVGYNTTFRSGARQQNQPASNSEQAICKNNGNC